LPNHVGVLIVADGMGGHRHGALASKTALSAIIQISPAGTEPSRWESLIHFANDALYDAMDRVPSSRGMGTTIAGVAIGKDQIVYFNVGDSRVYRHSGDSLARLSHDDVPLGTGSRTNRRSHQITQSLGGRTANTPIRPHVGTTSALNVEETLLICSDGLTDMVSERLVNATISEERELERCVCKLLRLALDAGGRDNVSIIAARVQTA
jgi:serine/threonine protein phosphatase PrpC